VSEVDLDALSATEHPAAVDGERAEAEPERSDAGATPPGPEQATAAERSDAERTGGAEPSGLEQAIADAEPSEPEPSDTEPSDTVRTAVAGPSEPGPSDTEPSATERIAVAGLSEPEQSTVDAESSEPERTAADLSGGDLDEAAELPDEEGVESDLPALTGDADLEAVLESLLLVVDSPVEEELLATVVGMPATRVTETLRRMADTLTEGQRGIDLRKVGGGWRFYTRDKFAPYVEKLLLDGQRARLTRAALETLAVIAYRQPVTRQRVAAVRGVNVDGVIRTLLARGLIEETGTDSDTGGFLFRTTELFLERIGLSSLDDLPPIAPLLPEVDSIDDV
jgi:segregation and condensation protein B